MNKNLLYAILIVGLILAYVPVAAAEEAGVLTIQSTQVAITIDGDPAEWGTWTCPSFPTPDGKYGTWVLRTVNGIQQWIWCDAPGDERTDFASPDKRVDLLQFRITGDADYLYMLFVFNDLSGFYIGDDGGTFIAVTINRNGTGVQEWFAGDSNTRVHSDARWAYQVVINLADSRYRNQGRRQVTDGLQANWGGIFYLVDSTWAFRPDPGALMGANVDKHAVEVRIPWSLIGGVPSGGRFFLRLSLITGRGWSNYAGNQGGTWDIGGGGVSDALDAMTTIGPNTWHDVQDQVVDYYIDLPFATTPPYVPIPEPGILIGIATALTAGGGVLYGLKRKRDK